MSTAPAQPPRPTGSIEPRSAVEDRSKGDTGFESQAAPPGPRGPDRARRPGLRRRDRVVVARRVRWRRESSPAAAASPSAAPEPVKLTLWHNYGVEANAKVTDALIAAYEASTPDVTIEAGQPASRQLLRAAQDGSHRQVRART